MIAVNTPYFIGSICAIILNLVIPIDLIDDIEVELEESWQEEEEEALETKDKDLLGEKGDVEAVHEDVSSPTQKSLADADAFTIDSV
jgi:hypothetical protein